jgi:lipoyl(octanoyl) transferase
MRHRVQGHSAHDAQAVAPAPPDRALSLEALARPLAAPGGVQWLRSDRPVPYPAAVAAMEERVAAIAAGAAGEAVWLLEHPALFTAGTSARDDELLDAAALPVFRTGRGGRYTYHGPGQRVAYVMLDLRRRGADIRAFVAGMEGWLIAALSRLGIEAERRPGRVGVWVALPGGGEAKIAAVGVRVRRWITYHGISLNVDPDLGHYRGIVPCGIAEHGVTSLRALGLRTAMADVDRHLMASFSAHLPGCAA